MTTDNKALLIDNLFKADHMLSMISNGISEMFNFIEFNSENQTDLETKENLNKILEVTNQLRSAVQYEGNKLNGNE